MIERSQQSHQNHADISTFICAICYGLLVVMMLNPPSGGAALGLIFPLIFVVILHISLGLHALSSALMTGRFYRNLWVYLYFLGVTVSSLMYVDVHKMVWRAANSVFERQGHSSEWLAYEGLTGRDTEMFQEAMSAGADPNHCFDASLQKSKRSLIQFAVTHQDTSAVLTLLNAGAQPDKVCREGTRTALVTAARFGMTGAVEALLEAGANPNISGKDTPLGAALATSSYVPQPYVDSTRVDQQKAEKLPRMRRIQQALLDAGADINAIHYDAYPIHWAVYYDDTELLQQQLGAGVDINRQDNRRRSPAALAAWHRSWSTLELLLGEPDIDLSGLNGYYVLEELGRARNEGLLELAFERGLSVERMLDKNFKAAIDNPYHRLPSLGDALYEAHSSENEIYFDALLRAGVPLTIIDDRKRTLVTRFAHDAEKLQRLIDKGLSVDLRMNSGGTALHFYAGCKTCTDPVSAMKNLVDAGADINAVNDRGMTPLRHANWFKIPDTARYLESLGAIDRFESDYD